jgi:hypothetical protein
MDHDGTVDIRHDIRTHTVPDEEKHQDKTPDTTLTDTDLLS